MGYVTTGATVETETSPNKDAQFPYAYIASLELSSCATCSEEFPGLKLH